ncbi:MULTISPECIES: enoyl-CoA hydratase/isomerase family protein [unclassified Herbaspirillum]|uniref:enoyl-CoA hydratase/isomerase family protein n=1 Tax=unclassified Herbaspirillum TaxID=2624150 RepID=UPI000E2EF59F|nr:MULTISPECIES: enoyl-CoA hydratase/isomerase family protein [unclassified Herbaspirillum]RFB67886.1 enoyl-CoA hydratase/isomerase family protein [Herbaspirillum sp. 3R-3a1]TFI06322.1 enoyl-CoA hydratase/isomerase family protein [Herbaspirillum sp. 3R11]TFI14066.1 enoyl-CoA hydratase/isomerase family protein [Herbaspirillum sp. 3R-11]TFI27871.1 enoyl-CoA hydratase/isomerase family protein [Herbaspirillum sp. 3C11]
MSQPVLFEELATQNGRRIGVATLASEKTLNALSLDMVHLLTPQLRQWARDPEIAMVLLQAQGEKAFCAGGDLQKIYTSMREHHASPARDDIRGNQYAADFFEHEYRLDYEIHTYPKPILCWGHGIVMGGGIGLMAGCSHRVVTERSRLAMPEITIGLYPDVGGSWFLSRTPGKLGAFLALTGALMNAEDAKFTGLADYRIAHADKQKVIDALQLQNWGDGDDAAVLGRVLQQAERDVAADVTFAPSALRENFDLINTLCSGQTVPDIVDAILAHKSDNPWLQKAIATLTAGAPGSAALALELQRRVRHMSLAEVFRLEFVVTLHCARRPDFVEGIRALIMEKDHQPKWNPARLADATPQWVDGFFVDPWPASEHPLADLV